MENLDLLIRELAKQPSETPWLEFKRNNADPEMIGKDICALANAAALQDRAAAYLVWGVDDKTHELQGTTFRWRTAKKGSEELEGWLRRALSGNADFAYDSVRMDEKWYGVLTIRPALDKTVMFNKVEYIRIGSSTRKLNDYPQIKADLWGRLRNRDFESQVSKKDLSPAQALNLLDYPAYYSLLGQSIPEGNGNILHYLEEDGLVRKQDNGLFCITNLGAILFARKLSHFPSVARKAFRAVQFRGNNNIEMVREYTGEKGYAAGFEELATFLDAVLPSREVIDGALRRKETVFPPIAIREAVANALIHQDLAQTGTGPVVEIYADRVEIRNPGLPLVDVNRIIDSPPKSRNEKLAALTRRMHICEELGSGWDKICLACETCRLPSPKIDLYAAPESTKVTLFSYAPYSLLSREERLRACYFHACLTYVFHEPMNNASLRKRFGMDEKSSPAVSRLLKDAVEKGLIRPAFPDTAPRYQRYIPAWA